MCAAIARKVRGQPDFPNSSLVATWIGPITANSNRSRTLRIAARNCELLAAVLAVALEGDAVELHAVIDEAEAELFGNALLELLQFLVDEFDHRTRFDVD